MEVTLSGRDMSAREVHPEKAESPMEITASGRDIVFRAVQLMKAYLSIAVTLAGMREMLAFAAGQAIRVVVS